MKPAPSLETQLRRSVFHVQQQKKKKAKALQMTNAIELDHKLSSAPTITVHRDVSGPLEFTPQQTAMIRDTYANGADPREFQVLMEIAKVRRLNPLLRQVHFVKRWDNNKGREVWSVQVSVDGLRAIAERTGKYDGQDEPEYELDDKGRIVSCKVKVYRKDWSRPAVGVAFWSEYVQTKKDGSPTKFWVSMPRVMIAKCAEAIAMRKAFPEDMGGLYVDEEMQQAENGRAEPSLSLSPHSAPDEDRDAPSKDSDEYNDIMGTMGVADRAVFDPACTWETMTHWRGIIGSKGEPSLLGKRLSKLFHGDDIAPSQRKEMGALWNRIDRKLTALEGKLKPPPVEATFTDAPEADGTEAFGASRESGDDDEEEEGLL
jgi:phage recombination protein Bet